MTRSAILRAWHGSGERSGSDLGSVQMVLWEIGVLWQLLPRVLSEIGGAPGSAPH